jgi:hypothetical protein
MMEGWRLLHAIEVAVWEVVRYRSWHQTTERELSAHDRNCEFWHSLIIEEVTDFPDAKIYRSSLIKTWHQS